MSFSGHKGMNIFIQQKLIKYPLYFKWASQVVLVVKNLPANSAATRDLGLTPGLGRSWRRKWQTTPVFLPGESPRTEEPGRLQSLWSQIVGHDRAHSLSIILGPGHIAETKADKNKTKQTKTPCTVYI